MTTLELRFSLATASRATGESHLWLERDAQGQVALAMGNERFFFEDPQQMRLLAAALSAEASYVARHKS
jgi:hypothetical protein